MLYAGFVLLNPLLLRLTFVANRGLRGVALQRAVRRSPLAREILAIPSILIPNIERAPVQLQAVLLEHVFTGADALRIRLSRAYTGQLLSQGASLLGSVDALGNPVGFFHDFGDGVKAFFYEPAQGATISPEEFAKGMGKGSLQLLRGSIFALFGSASKIVGTIGSGVARLAMDDEYAKARQQQRQKRADNVLEGIGHGLLAFGGGLVSGVSGIVTQPIKGAQNGGAEGFFVGLGRGLVGAVVKPAVGVLDLASRTTEGIKNTPDMLEAKAHPRRAPRFFGPDRILRVYNADRAHERERLRTMKGGRYRSMRLELVQRIDHGNMFVITHSHAILFDEKMKQKWLASYASMLDVTLEKATNTILIDCNLSVVEKEFKDAEEARLNDISRALIPREVAKPNVEQLQARRLKVICSSPEQAERLTRALKSAFYRFTSGVNE